MVDRAQVPPTSCTSARVSQSASGRIGPAMSLARNIADAIGRKWLCDMIAGATTSAATLGRDGELDDVADETAGRRASGRPTDRSPPGPSIDDDELLRPARVRGTRAARRRPAALATG